VSRAFICAGAFIATTALAPGTAQHPVLPAALLSYFSGSWHGVGAFAKGRHLESDITFTPAVDGQGLLVRGQERPPNHFKYIALWSMDTVGGQPVMLLAANLGGGARLFRSNGWHDDAIVFQTTSKLRSWFALERFTYQRKTGSIFIATYEYSTDNGISWRFGDRQTFTRVRSR
jgi:hypothetical protein